MYVTRGDRRCIVHLVIYIACLWSIVHFLVSEIFIIYTLWSSWISDTHKHSQLCKELHISNDHWCTNWIQSCLYFYDKSLIYFQKEVLHVKAIADYMCYLSFTDVGVSRKTIKQGKSDLTNIYDGLYAMFTWSIPGRFKGWKSTFYKDLWVTNFYISFWNRITNKQEIHHTFKVDVQVKCWLVSCQMLTCVMQWSIIGCKCNAWTLENVWLEPRV
jgi:hypothetical protein